MEIGNTPRFNRKIKLSHIIIICLIAIAVTAAATYFIVMSSFGSKQYLNDAKKFVEIEKIIDERFIGESDDSALYDAAAAAMIKSLDDKWSYYMSPEQYAAYKLSSANEYAGIGVSVKLTDSGKFEITDVYAGTPAYSAGLKAGQYIVSIDGTAVEGKTLEEVETLIRSKLNKDFSMVLDSDGDELSVKLSCSILFKDPVSSSMLEGHIGYIKISNFEAGSSENTIKAVEKLIAAGADSFIFDVRSNPGGLLSELCSLLDYILPEGDLFVSIDRAGNETVEKSDKISLGNKMTVLVNENTYSAAEFFAAALQEYHWATVIGQQTTGKSRSQVTIELTDGSAVHLSTNKYLTPNRVDLAEVGGVVPDITVDKESTTGDPVRDAALKALK